MATLLWEDREGDTLFQGHISIRTAWQRYVREKSSLSLLGEEGAVCLLAQ